MRARTQRSLGNLAAAAAPSAWHRAVPSLPLLFECGNDGVDDRDAGLLRLMNGKRQKNPVRPCVSRPWRWGEGSQEDVMRTPKIARGSQLFPWQCPQS